MSCLPSTSFLSPLFLRWWFLAGLLGSGFRVEQEQNGAGSGAVLTARGTRSRPAVMQEQLLSLIVHFSRIPAMPMPFVPNSCDLLSGNAR